MKKLLRIGLAALAACLAGGEAWAQGLSATRGRGSPYGYYSPFDALGQQQAISAERVAEQRAAAERSQAAIQSSLAEHEAARLGAAAGAEASQQAIAARSAAARDAQTQRAWATYQASTERRIALARGAQAALPTDLVAAGPAGSAATPTASAPRRSTEAVSTSVKSARGAAVRAAFHRPDLFTQPWLEKHPGAWRPDKWASLRDTLGPRADASRGAAAQNAWLGPEWAALNAWLAWNVEPFPYDFGTAAVFRNGRFIYDGRDLADEDGFCLYGASIAKAGASGDKPGDEWMPLGVFAVVQEEQTDPSAVVQLAVNKAGLIRGNYYTPLTDTTLPIRGKAEKVGQRIAGTVGDKTETVFDMGSYNVTQDEVPVLLHVGKELTQQRLLVRLKQPEEQSPDAKPAPPPDSGQPTAQVVVRVPADAELWFEGQRTSLAGVERSFTTPPLEKGQAYMYRVRARWTENGLPVEQTRQIEVRAGERAFVEFPGGTP